MPKRLPVLQAKPPAAHDDAPRPPWHWVGIGAVLVFAIWAPLAMLAQAASSAYLRRALPEGRQVDAWLASQSGAGQARFWAIVVGLPLLAFVLACAAGGALVGRFGGRAGKKEATVAGLLASSLAWALAASLMGGFDAVVSALATLIVLVPIGTVAARAGGRWGERKRPFAGSIA